jgi:creatinine amidohydrolase/Fe(II)-dependent formamide hydrolase-like protein
MNVAGGAVLTRLLVAAFILSASIASAQSRSLFVEDLTWPELREAIAGGKASAIVWAGGIEQNGPHMAFIKHNVIGRYAAEKIAERLGDALVYPSMPFSVAGDPLLKTGHSRLPGTISLSPELYLGVMRQLALSAVAAGFTRVFIMGEHGQGQNELRGAAESLDADWRAKGVRVFYVADFNVKANQQIDAYLKEKGLRPGGHAAVGETSQVMFLDEGKKWIRADKMAAAAAGPTADTGVNDPTGATAELGRTLIDYKVAAAVEQIRTLLKTATPAAPR